MKPSNIAAATQPELALLPERSATPAFDMTRTLGAPCGYRNSHGHACQRLGTVPLSIDGEYQYDGDRLLILCDWRACFLGGEQ